MQHSPDTAAARLRVLLVTEGTYPFHWGGVSTWCHLLIRDLPNVDFSLLSIVSDQRLEPQFSLPPNVVDFRVVPLWGIRDILEIRRKLRLADIRQMRQRTTPAVIEAEFIPVFEAFLNDLFTSNTGAERLGTLLHTMYRFFLTYDFDTALRSPAAWNTFARVAYRCFAQEAEHHSYTGTPATVADLTTGMQWLSHWLFPLAVKLPEVDVVHASMAGVCGIVAAVTKLEYGAGFMLSEHGIYLRERYLAESASQGSFFLKLFSLRFARRMTSLAYALADQISPCCDYNQRWELHNGVSADRLRTIYYGADGSEFSPRNKPIGEPPVVVWVGRINPLKDLVTLLKAAKLVHDVRSDIEFQLYGNASPEDAQYYKECLDLRAELGLQDTALFAGYAVTPADAYNQGDVVVLSSISEGFPFATLEAMLCGKPVVATAVGGLPEQIEGCGIAVEPRNAAALADAILTLMNDPELCARLGHAAREIAEDEFSVRQSASAHWASYVQLAQRADSSLGAADEAPGSSGALPVAGSERSAVPMRFLDLAPEMLVERYLGGRALEETPPDLERLREQAVGVGELYQDASPATDGGSRAQLWRMANAADGAGPLWVSQHGPGAAPPLRLRSKRQFRTANGKEAWVPRDLAAIATLGEQLLARDPYPIDYLEVTAVLESLGITDDVAAEHYGAPNTFALAERVLVHIDKERRPAPPVAEPPFPTVDKRVKEQLYDYSRGVVALAPGLVLLLIINAVDRIGGWPPEHVMFLSLGMTISMLFANAFIQAILRRAALYLGVQHPRAAGKFVFKSLAIAYAAMLLCGMLIAGVGLAVGLMNLSQGLIFGIAFVALLSFWMAGGWLVLVRRQGWFGVALGVGLAGGLVTDRVVAAVTPAHLAISSTVGYMLALTIIAGAVMASRPASSASRGLTILPSFSYLWQEMAPYFGYSLLYVAFILVPHLLAWLGRSSAPHDRLSALLALEISLTLAIPPVVLAGGLAERTLRQFWSRTRQLQSSVLADEPHAFGQQLATFARQQRRHYLIVMLALSLAVFGAVRLGFTSGYLDEWIAISQRRDVLVLCALSLVGYALVGWALFNAMFCITLGRPRLALHAVLLGMLVMATLGVPLVVGVDLRYALWAFTAGALMFAVASTFAVNHLWRSAAYYYYAAT